MALTDRQSKQRSLFRPLGTVVNSRSSGRAPARLTLARESTLRQCAELLRQLIDRISTVIPNSKSHRGEPDMSTAVMVEPIAEASPRPRARITSVVYLFYFLTAISGELFLKGLVADGDAASTANNILAHQSLFRLGWATGLIATACYVAVTALFYELFKPVNRSLSLLAAFFSLVGCTILAFASLFQLAPLVVLGGGQYLSVFKVEQLRALASLFLELYGLGVSICFVFFGVYCLLIGFLIFKSSFLPRILGVLMAFAGLGWLTFLFPPLANHLSPYNLVLGFLAELALMLWLLVMGVDVQRWKERARAA
jgi:hypothetical protein